MLLAAAPRFCLIGFFQEAHRVRSGHRIPFRQPMLPVVVPELRLLPALQIEQMAFLESGGIVNDGHQEVAAQDFLGTFQDEVGVAVAQNGRDRALDGRGAHRAESGLLPGQQIAGHRHAPGLEKMQDPLQGLAPGLVRRASEPGRQERRDRRVEDISQGRHEVQVPQEILGDWG